LTLHFANGNFLAKRLSKENHPNLLYYHYNNYTICKMNNQ
jgi:hypothetical protein